MRILHARTDLLGGRLACRGSREDSRGNSRSDERQYLPLRLLPQHRRRDRGGHAGRGREAGAMIDFDYVKARDVGGAVKQIARQPDARFIAGGTNLIDLMKENVAKPGYLIDITGLPLAEIEETEAGGLRIGALVPNSDLAYDRRVRERYPLLSSAILAGASA